MYLRDIPLANRVKSDVFLVRSVRYIYSAFMKFQPMHVHDQVVSFPVSLFHDYKRCGRRLVIMLHHYNIQVAINVYMDVLKLPSHSELEPSNG